MDKDRIEDCAEQAKGKVKEVVGALADNDDLKREGEAQQEKGEAQRDVAAKEAEAERAEKRFTALGSRREEEVLARQTQDLLAPAAN